MKDIEASNQPLHTPGPWDWNDMQNVWGQAGEVLVADVDGRTQLEEEANVRLIAAAPELLEALSKTQDIILQILTDSQLDTRLGCGRTVREWSRITREAIAKAKGEDR